MLFYQKCMLSYQVAKKDCFLAVHRADGLENYGKIMMFLIYPVAFSGGLLYTV